MINLNLEKCNGCAACYNKCPKKAITMQENNEGFLYPVIDNDKCISCGLCEKICPLTNKNNNQIEKVFYGWNLNEEARKEGSSGGVFYILAKHVLSNGGVVFASAYDYQTNDTRHKMVSSLEELPSILKSKYTQSVIGDTYVNVKQKLDDNILVLFCGTPCQVNGLSSFLGKKYNNLILVDFVCHGVPSPKVWKYFLANLTKNKEIRNVDFRNKKYGAKNYSMLVNYGHAQYVKSHNKDLFLRLFLSDVILRKSCYNCVAKGENRTSDITISDFWGAENYGVSKNECKKGVSLFAVYNKTIYDLIVNTNELFIKEVDKKIMYAKPSFNNSAKKPGNRVEYFQKVNNKNFFKESKKYTRFYLVKKIINKMKRMIKKII